MTTARTRSRSAFAGALVAAVAAAALALVTSFGAGTERTTPLGPAAAPAFAATRDGDVAAPPDDAERDLLAADEPPPSEYGPEPAATIVARVATAEGPAMDVPGQIETEARNQAESVPVATFVTSRDGTATCMVPAGFYVVRLAVSSDRFQTVRARAADVHTVEFRIEPTVAVRGKVLDANGAAVAGATVTVAPLSSVRPAVVAARTAPDGAFAFVLEPRPCKVGALGDGHGPATPEIVFGSAGQTIELTLRLTAGARLGGVVVDEGGRPVPGTVVLLGSALRLDEASRTLTGFDAVVRTSANGEFRFGGVARGRSRLSARHPAHRAWAADVLVGDESLHHRIVLAPGAVATGSVRAPHGEPVVGASVHLIAASGERMHATSRADGAFTFDGLAPGPAVVTAFHEHFGAAERPVDLTPARATRVDVVLEPGTAMRVEVVDAKGWALPGASVTARLRDAAGSPRATLTGTTDARGELSFEHARPDWTATLSAGKAHYARATLTTPCATTVRLTLRPQVLDSSVHGRVVDDDGGPVSRAFVVVGMTGADLPWAVTDVDGRFRFEEVPSGSFFLRVAKTGHGIVRVEGFRAAANPVDVGTIRLLRGGTIAIAQTGADGRPVPRGRFMVHRDDDGRLLTQGSTRDGVGISDHVPAGTYRVCADGEGLRAVSTFCRVVAGQQTSVHVAHSAGETVLVTLVPPESSHAASAVDLKLQDDSGVLFDGAIAANAVGSHEIGLGCASRLLHVQVSSAGYEPIAARVRVGDLPRKGARLSLRLHLIPR